MGIDMGAAGAAFTAVTILLVGMACRTNKIG